MDAWTERRAHEMLSRAEDRQAVCQCSIHAMDGEAERLIAVAQGTIVAASRDRQRR